MSNNETIESLEAQLELHNSKSKERVDIINQLVAFYLNIDLNKTKTLIDEEERISTDINYQEGIGMSYHQRGVYFYLLGDYENALNFYLKADIILNKSADWKNRIKPKANIAMVYMNTQQYEEALRIYNEIENEIKLIPIDIIHAQMYINIDAAYCFLKDPKNGIVYSQKALQISEQLNSRYGIAVSESNLGGHLILLNKPEEALQHIARSKEICEADGYTIILLSNFIEYADCYLRLQQYETALGYAEKAIPLARKVQDIEKEAYIMKHIMNIYERQEDFKNAFIASRTYIELKEKMLNNDKIKSFNTLQLKYESEKKEAALNQLRLQQTQSELTALKSQMNPHFIFNALNSIQELYTIGDKKMANEQMGNFAQLTRKILDVSGKQKIELAEEIDILTKYLELECMRFENDFSYKIHLSDNLDEDYTTLPPMLIQPYVENSIKHGLLHKKGSKQLDIYFELDEDANVLKCSVDDNGIGRQASASLHKNRSASHVSFSTSATEKRLRLLNQGKEEMIAVQFEDKEDESGNTSGTRVIIQIPV
ncbi:MAG: histidine kinase [Sphingobacteriales bacterium]|nr:histidine kinase [Sphingobacteriales bacterium]